MTKRNLILSAAVAGMIAGVSGTVPAEAKAKPNAEKGACGQKGHKCEGKDHAACKEGKMEGKKGEMACSENKCGHGMKKDAPTPDATAPATPTEAPAEGH